jgi:hypothetical protein
MVSETIVMSIELVGGTTLVLTIGALTAAANRLRRWIASRNPQGLAPAHETAQPIAQVQAQIDPYRDPAGERLLAEALGINRDRLNSARREAHSKILSHLLDDSLIPPKGALPQANERQRPAQPSSGQSADEVAFLAFLAEGLGISLNVLQQARESALETALTLALEEGSLTETQMRDRLMRYRAHAYLDPTSLLSESLDITMEELEDRSLSDWIRHRHLTWRALNARLNAAREDALAQAIADGVLLPTDAERLREESAWAVLVDSHTLERIRSQIPQYGFLYRQAATMLN